MIEKLLEKDKLDKSDIVSLLGTEGKEKEKLFTRSAEMKKNHVGQKVYFRGLIEFSNICRKDCLYCGIRRSNPNVSRYSVSDTEILEAVDFALKSKFASVVLQSGELENIAFVDRIENLLKQINTQTGGKIRVTLSLGEQTTETYERWFNAGAQRYLLRIETSNPELYRKLHPDNPLHSFEQRLQCVRTLKKPVTRPVLA